MPKKTIAFLICIVVITGALAITVFLAKNPAAPNASHTGIQNKITQENLGTAVVTFSPPMLNLAKNTTPQAVMILLNSGNSEVTGVQLHMKYDPKTIWNVKISAPPSNNFFGDSNSSVVINQVDGSNGEILYALAIPPLGQARSGSGAVAMLTFTPYLNVAVPFSTISFSQHTIVTTKNTNQESTLRSASPLSLYFTPPGLTPVP